MKNGSSFGTNPADSPAGKLTNLSVNQADKEDLIEFFKNCPNGVIITKLDEKGRPYKGFYQSSNTAVILDQQYLKVISDIFISPKGVDAEELLRQIHSGKIAML